MKSDFRWIVIGVGNQGSKHREALGPSCVGTIDQPTVSAGIAKLDKVPKDSFDCVVICTPENVKNIYVQYALNNEKNVLVEKPIPLNPQLLSLIKKSLENGIMFQPAYDHQFDPGIRLLIEKINGLNLEELRWTSLRINYSFGTETLIKSSPWMDFGTGPWELVAPHALRILSEIDMDLGEDFTFAFGMGDLKSPSRVTGLRSGKKYVEITCSYTSWLNAFNLEFTWEDGTFQVIGLTKWGESTFTEYSRVHPAGKPKITDYRIFEARTAVQSVAALYENVFTSDLSHALTCDEFVSRNLQQARTQLAIWNNAP